MTVSRDTYIARMLAPLRHALALTPAPVRQRPPRPAPAPPPFDPEALARQWPFRNPPPGFRKSG